jgi:hypothetical protein
MKKILSVFTSIAFQALCLVGTAYSEPPMVEENEKAYSEEKPINNESILEMLSPGSADVIKMEKEMGDLDALGKEVILPPEELEMEKDEEDKEKGNTIL